MGITKWKIAERWWRLNQEGNAKTLQYYWDGNYFEGDSDSIIIRIKQMNLQCGYYAFEAFPDNGWDVPMDTDYRQLEMF